jgi:hypothetical protein
LPFLAIGGHGEESWHSIPGLGAVYIHGQAYAIPHGDHDILFQYDLNHISPPLLAVDYCALLPLSRGHLYTRVESVLQAITVIAS